MVRIYIVIVIQVLIDMVSGTRFEMGSLTEVSFSCSLLLNGVYWVFGGAHEKRQVRNLSLTKIKVLKT